MNLHCYQLKQVNITSDIYIPELDQINHTIVNVKKTKKSLNSFLTRVHRETKEK